MTSTPHQRFTFDTEFDGDGAVSWKTPRPKRTYTPEEVEVIRAEAFAEGERSMIAQAEQDFSAALAQVAHHVQMALPALARVAHDHRSGATELALACGRKIADAALAKFPEAPVVAALAELAREVEAAPRLTVRIAPDLVERAQQALTELGQAVGFAGALVVTGDPAMPAAAFTLDWGEGRAAFDPNAAAERITRALETALAAEGLHAEPLIPATEPDIENRHG